MEQINQAALHTAGLRERMKQEGIDVYLITIGDYHNSEYISEHYKTLRFMSGFSGSAGTVVVTADKAGLWADGRYHLQAEHQLEGSGITLFKMGMAGVPTVNEFIAAECPMNGTIGFDGKVVTASLAESIKEVLKDKNPALLFDKDLAGDLWEDRPALDFHPVFQLDTCYTGETALSKIKRVREEMKKEQAGYHLLTALDDIAWLLNIRGNDIPYNPVVFSFVLMDMDKTVLYACREQFSAEIEEALKQEGVVLKDYMDIFKDIQTIPSGSSILLDPNRVSMSLMAGIPEGVNVIRKINPTTMMKCIKNQTEIASLWESHRKDGVAMVKFLYWLKHHPHLEEETEITASDYLEQCRLEQGAFQLSFNTIAAYGPNAAMMHYSAAPETTAHLQPQGFLLVDSGGQYLEGTTDITRTIVLGSLTQEEKEHFTVVLRSMLRLSSAHFMKGCRGFNLDILARGPVWDLGLDYRCGTGHGVGFCLNVHEPPNGFRWNVVPERNDSCILEPGMVTTDEPGIYLDGKYGIRTENELLCVEGPLNEYGQFLEFRTLTFCPIDREAIIKEIMDNSEIRALNAYHETVYQTLAPSLTEEEKQWLREVTLPL